MHRIFNDSFLSSLRCHRAPSHVLPFPRSREEQCSFLSSFREGGENFAPHRRRRHHWSSFQSTSNEVKSVRFFLVTAFVLSAHLLTIVTPSTADFTREEKDEDETTRIGSAAPVVLETLANDALDAARLVPRKYG
jgi:hypothetical protein